MKKRFFLPAMMLAVAFASCSNEEDATPQSSRAALGVNVAVHELTDSRAMVHGNKLPGGSEIGISVVANADGSAYDGNTADYMNVAYQATGEGDAQEWEPLTPGFEILLSGTEGKAVAYYPYDDVDEESFDYTAIAVDIEEQKDWMWSGWSDPFNDAEPNVSFELNHAQTAVNVKVVRDATYTGAGVISALTVTSEGLAKKGNFSAVDGTFDAASITGAEEDIAIISSPFTLTADDAGTTEIKENEKENPYMFVPAASTVVPFTVKATIDGKNYTVDVNMTTAFEAGKIYKIAVKISNVGLTVDGVVIVNDWSGVDLPEGTLTPAQ